MIIASNLYHSCCSFYQSLHKNLPTFAKIFATMGSYSCILIEYVTTKVVIKRDNKNIGVFLYVSLPEKFGAT